MTPSTRATITAAAATVVAAGAFAGTRFLALAIFALLAIASFGWPSLLRISHHLVGSVIIIAGGSLALVGALLGRTEPYLRYVAIALAATIMAALIVEVFLPSAPGRAVTSVAATATAGTVAATAAAWVAANRTPGSEDLVVAGAATLAVAAIASVITRSIEINALLAVFFGGLAGFGTGYLFESISWWGGLIIGIVAGAATILVHELARREPPPATIWAGMASAFTPVFMTGVLVYVAGRLLVG